MSVVTNCWEYEKIKFSAGEPHVKVSERIAKSKSEAEYIWWNFENVEEFFTVAMLCNVADANGKIVTLEMPYVPFARQDRATTFNQPFSLEIFCNFLKTLPIDGLVVVDVHSDVFFDIMEDAEFIIEHIKQVEAHECALFGTDVVDPQWDCVIAPDNGSVSKADKIADYWGIPLVCATKVRDPLTGQLSSPTIDFGGLKPKRALIPDDILDYGGTFVQLANEIKKQFPDIKLDLYVTHGIFAGGVDKFKGLFENIYCYNIMNKEITSGDLVNLSGLS